MIINPQTAVEKGWITSPYLPLEDEQMQPNGVDVRLKCVSKFHMADGLTPPMEMKVGYVAHLPKYECSTIRGSYRLYKLKPYDFTCYEYVKIPEGVVAFVYGRSSLNRNGILARAGVYDSGFANWVGFTVYPFSDFRVEPKSRVAQILFMEAETAHLYQGQYQNEKMP